MNIESTHKYTKPTWMYGLFGIVALLGMALLVGVAVMTTQNSTNPNPKADGGSASKLSAFFYGGFGSQEAKNIVNACPKVITVLNPGDSAAAKQLITDYKTKCPQGKVVARILLQGYPEHVISESLYDPVSHQLTQAGISDAQSFAETYFSAISPKLNAMSDIISKVDYIESPNEAEVVTDWSGSREANWLMHFYNRLADKVESHRSNLAICPSIAVGDVGGDTDNGIAFKMDVTKAMWQHVKDLGGAMCYHAYSYDLTKDANHERWLPFRYRIFQPYAAGIPVILSEAGAETLGGHNGGWKAKGIGEAGYESWLTWFDSEIKKDGYVIGAPIYAYGSNGDNYDIAGPLAQWLAQFIASGGSGGGNGGGGNGGGGNGGGGGNNGTPTPNPTPTDGGGAQAGCYNSCYSATSGNGSGCRYVCDNRPACWQTCKDQGKACLTKCLSTTPTPTKTPTVTPVVTPISTNPTAVSVCFGNATGVGGRCYDCNGDATINILDFACFSRRWLNTVN